MKKSHIMASAILLAMTAGCTATPVHTQANCCDKNVSIEMPTVKEAPLHVVAPVKKDKSDLIKITGIGYGAESTYAAYTPGQRRLMAIRAAKLDAYRSLAEQLSGIKIDSNTSISTMTAKNDSFRARINAVVRGARLISVTPMADNNYETVLEVYVDKAFFEKAFIYSVDEASASDPETVYRARSY